MASAIFTVHEYEIVAANLARVTLTCNAGTYADKSDLFDEVSASFENQARPVKDSFRWIDDGKNYCVGFVVPNREIRHNVDVTAGAYREVASNLYMDEADHSLWDVKNGGTGKYLVRHGVDDLAHLVEEARVSPRGSTPRLSSLVTASTEKHELVAFVSASRYGAEMDYGICLGNTDAGELRVLSHASRSVTNLPSSMVVGSYTLDLKNLPSIKKHHVKAATAMDPILSPEEYWKLQYAYNQPYLELVLKQVREMSAL